MKSNDELIRSYDRIAARYAEEFFGELADKPDDVALIERFVRSLREGGRVLDIGCGPGQVARALHDHGIDVVGIDICEAMVAEAKRLSPDIEYVVGDFLNLDQPDGSCAGIAGFYAIIHIGREQIDDALAELHRVLEPEGRLLLSFHGGKGQAVADSWYGEPVIIHATFFEADEMREHLVASGFRVEEIVTRDPLPFEFPVPRVFALATRA